MKLRTLRHQRARLTQGRATQRATSRDLVRRVTPFVDELVELLPYQREILAAIERGAVVMPARRTGMSLVRRLAAARPIVVGVDPCQPGGDHSAEAWFRRTHAGAQLERLWIDGVEVEREVPGSDYARAGTGGTWPAVTLTKGRR